MVPVEGEEASGPREMVRLTAVLSEGLLPNMSMWERGAYFHRALKIMSVPTLGIFKGHVLSLFFSHQKENAVDKNYAVFMNASSLKMRNSPFCDNMNSPIKHYDINVCAVR